MAISITSPSNANISDSILYVDVSVSGKTAGSTIAYSLRIHGTSIASSSVNATGTRLSFTAANLYSALDGKSLTNAVTIRAQEIINGVPQPAQEVTGGRVTINARISGLGWSTMSNPYNLDSPDNLRASWSRPHSAFRARVKVYVHNTLVVNRYNFQTSISYMPTEAQINNMISAMGGVSPRALKVEVITQFNANSPVDLETTGQSITRSSGVIKSFAERSTLSAFSEFTIGDSINFTIQQNTSGVTHDIELRIGNTTVMTRTNVGTGSRSIAPTSGETTAMYNATSTVTSATATLVLVTRLSGSQVGISHSRTATATVGANIEPDFTTITHAEITTSPDVATLIGAYVESVSSLALAITGATPGTGATISSYRITLGTNTINAASGQTGPLAYSGTNLQLTGRVTDSRGRSKEKSVQVTILPYKPPQAAVSFYRCTADGNESIIGEYVRFGLAVTASSLVVSGNEKNTLAIALRTRESGASAWNVKQVITPPGVNYNGQSNILSGYPVTNAYDGRVEVTDALSPATVVEGSVSSGIVLALGREGVGVGKLPVPGRLFDTAGPMFEDGLSLFEKYGATVGSNANGHWIRFENGVQICWNRQSMPVEGPGTETESITFPASFVGSTGNLAISLAPHSGVPHQRIMSFNSPTVNGFIATVRIGDGYSGNLGYTWQAVGYWRV